jgi:serine phosphatase RsbU (regulator of sigma subunit)
MKIKSGKTRPLRFSIRFKIALVMIGATFFVAAVIALAVFNQHEKKMRETIHRMTGPVIKGCDENLVSYLAIDSKLKERDARKLSYARRNYLYRERARHLKEATEYLARIIGSEKNYDIAFLIDLHIRDINLGWDGKHQSDFIYFNRKTTGILDTYPVDPFLKPTLLNYYMNNIDIDAHLVFSRGREESEKEFVIVGYPLFENKGDRAYYRRYLTYRNDSRSISGDTGTLEEERRELRKISIRKLVNNQVEFSYRIEMDDPERIQRIFGFFWFHYRPRRFDNEQYRNIRDFYLASLSGKIDENGLLLSDVKEISDRTLDKFRITPRTRKDDEDIWKGFYYYLTKQDGITINSDKDVHELNLLAFRSDLAGIAGIYILRHSFHARLMEDRKELVNLILSIVTRVAILAVFFPTFLIRSITRLNEAARSIGRGKLDTRITMGGSDELGQLADTMNNMAGNLQKAQKEIIIKERMENELKTAEAIQKTLLPETFPDMGGVSFGALYQAQSEAGGDYYDVISLEDDKLALVIADVSGHGVGSGLVMSMTRTLVHSHTRRGDSIRYLMEEINEYLYLHTANNYFVTIWYGIFDPKQGSLEYVSSGHNPAYLVESDEVKELKGGGIALGAVGRETFSRLVSTHKKNLSSGSMLVLYTDGVVEAMDKEGNEYGEERFMDLIRQQGAADPGAFVAKVERDVKRFMRGTEPHDDITLLVMKIR